jgi:hypothetical protein
VLAVAALLVSLSLPFFPNDLQAFGNNLIATAAIAGGLAWHMLNPPPDGKASSLFASSDAPKS